MTTKTTRLTTIERWRKRPLSPWVSWVLFLILSLMTTLIWTESLADAAFLSLRFAQTVGALEDFFAQLFVTSLGYTPLSPISWLVLAVPVQLGWQMEIVAPLVSAFGWGVTAVVWQRILRGWQLPIVDWLVPLILVISPVGAMASGSFVSWFVALAWLAVLLTVQRKWRAQTVVLILLPLVYVSITAVSLMITLIIWRIVVTKRFPLIAVILLGGVIGLASMGILWQINQVPWQISFPFVDWLGWGRQWLYAGEFVWLFVLFALAAVAGIRQTWPIVIWLLFALLDVNLIGQIVLASGMLFLAGVGVATISQWIVQKQWLDLEEKLVYLVSVILLCLPLAWVMLSSHRNQQADLFVLLEEIKVGEWLHENGEDKAVVLADSAVGYYADRTVWSWNGRSDQQSWADFIRIVEPMPPDFIITNDSLFWDGLEHLDWWRERYKLVQSIGVHNIWQFVPHEALMADTVPLNVVLENGVKLVGYQQSPQTIAPGEAVHVSLHFQVDEPMGNGFNTVMWLPSAVDEVNQAAQDLITPRGVPSNWWEPGQIVTEQFVLTTTEQIPIGGHRLMVSFREQDNFDKMPVYQNEDSNPLDRIQLDYVAVPWTGDVDESAIVFNMALGDEIKLLAADLPADSARPGDGLDIQLYWEAINLNRPQHDYTIFVHLLNGAGEMVANADGPPQGGRYPTGAWVPGDVVVDGHYLQLPSDLVPGKYEIRAGAYLLETGERLPVFDAEGNEQPGANLLLMKLVVE